MSKLPRHLIAVAAIVPALALLVGCTRFGATLDRPEDPVVLSGAQLPKLEGADPMHVVGFSWDGSAWHQIPVQVDERDFVNPGQVLNRAASAWATLPDGTPYRELVYTPPRTISAGYTSVATYTPPDSDPTLDGNDEVSFLANDSGQQASIANGAPPNVIGSSWQQVAVTDPLNGDQSGYVYLFRSNTLTGGSAGTTGVHYTFRLNAGDYETQYRMGTTSLAPNNRVGPNPETSTVVTPSYALTFGDRWLNDGLSMTTAGADGHDVLERGRFQFNPTTCGRSEATFDGEQTASPYEGAFIADISGPVRALRSYIGTNSGQYTIGTDVFYPQREDSSVELHVHNIPGVMTFDDFSTGLTGLRYFDDQHPAGTPITGNGSTLGWSAPPTWQMISGSAGSIVTTRSISTDIAGLNVTGYWLDHTYAAGSARPPAPCTGDLTAWGQNGLRVTSAIPCTDPTRYGTFDGCPAVQGQTTAKSFTATRVRYYEVPNLDTSAAALLASHAQQAAVGTVSG